ncbi:unnamed protein product [Thelazia callipaeda]|uniref:Secreted protein n=1 Tax=Thelazia callipaeda TaxID=103827 RepID=A0A0N5CV23_THECL|nr:unnamed protein product [Thelazia callipaeda]
MIDPPSIPPSQLLSCPLSSAAALCSPLLPSPTRLSLVCQRPLFHIIASSNMSTALRTPCPLLCPLLNLPPSACTV